MPREFNRSRLTNAEGGEAGRQQCGQLRMTEIHEILHAERKILDKIERTNQIGETRSNDERHAVIAVSLLCFCVVNKGSCRTFSPFFASPFPLPISFFRRPKKPAKPPISPLCNYTISLSLKHSSSKQCWKTWRFGFTEEEGDGRTRCDVTVCLPLSTDVSPQTD